MKKQIHFQSIKYYFEDKYDIAVRLDEFENKQTGEVYNVICREDADVALFTVKDGEYSSLNSAGQAVGDDTVFGYVNGDSVKSADGSYIIDMDDLVMSYKGNDMDYDYLSAVEENTYHERTSIVLDGMFSEGELTKFAVDKVVYVDEEDFENILKRNDMEMFKNYNATVYTGKDAQRNGLLCINEHTGDGIMVDTQGFNYARYMAYAPKIEMYAERVLEEDMRQNATYEMRLYSPIVVEEYDSENGDNYEIDPGYYFNDIRNKIRDDLSDCRERGLAKYFWRDEKCREKVYSIKPDIERVNDKVMGVAVIKLTKPLNDTELKSLKDYVTGQYSDGWGEGFEQHEIYSNGNEIYVHFWNDTDFYIHTEEEQLGMEQVHEDITEDIIDDIQM